MHKLTHSSTHKLTHSSSHKLNPSLYQNPSFRSFGLSRQNSREGSVSDHGEARLRVRRSNEPLLCRIIQSWAESVDGALVVQPLKKKAGDGW